MVAWWDVACEVTSLDEDQGFFRSVGGVEQNNSDAIERTQHDLNSVGVLQPASFLDI